MGRNYKKAEFHGVKERISEQCVRMEEALGGLPHTAEVSTQNKLTVMLMWGKVWAK